MSSRTNSRLNRLVFLNSLFIMGVLTISSVIAAPGATTPLEYTRRALEQLGQMNRNSLSETDAQHHSAAIEAIESLEELLLVQGHSESEAGAYRLYLSNEPNRFQSDIDLSYIGRRLIIQNHETTQFQNFERDPEHEGTWRARRFGEAQFSIEIVDQRTFRMILTYYTTDRNVNTVGSQYEAYYQRRDLPSLPIAGTYGLVSHSGGLPTPDTFDQDNFPQNLTLSISDENHLSVILPGYPAFGRPQAQQNVWRTGSSANIRIRLEASEAGIFRLVCDIHDGSGSLVRSTEAIYARRN